MRFQALRPDADIEVHRALAEVLWRELGTHDPEIAAEMELESRQDE